MTVYTSHVPDIDLGEPAGLFTFIFRNEHLFDSNTPAFVDALTDERYSRAQLRDLCLRFAFGVKKLGAKRSEVAMIFSPNSLSFPIALLGLAAAGVKATLANSSYLPNELAHQIKNSRAHFVFVHPALLPMLLKTFAQMGVTEQEATKRVVLLSYTGLEKKMEAELGLDKKWMRLEDFLKWGKLEQEEKFTGDQVHDSTMLCYSSGTTGLSKGVETTHYNLQAVTQTLKAFYRPIGKDDIALSLLPFFHIYGVSMILLYHFRLGCPQVVLTKFDPELFCSTIQKYQITVSGIVPPILVVLLHHPAVTKYDMKSLKWLSSGAAPLGLELVQKVKERFASVGNKEVIVTQGYGLTETSPATHLLPAELSIKKAGSIGYLVPNMQARLVGEDDRDVPTGPKNSGELWLKGPLIMKGYLHNEKATKDSITPDGWFKTGDIAIRDNEGLYYIVDRKKELIKYKGFQVPPADLEGVLISSPDVADVAVIGIYSKSQATELPRAYIVPHPSLSISLPSSHPLHNQEFEKRVQEWIKTKVAQHKYLRGGVRIMSAIPKSATGKILRKDLRVLAEREEKEAAAGGASSARL